MPPRKAKVDDGPVPRPPLQSHSKYLISAIIDISPDMAGNYISPVDSAPINTGSPTIFQEAVSLMKLYHARRMLYYPDDVFSLVQMGAEDYDTGTKESLPTCQHIDLGLSMEKVSSEQCSNFDFLQLCAASFKETSILNAITVASQVITEKHAENKRLQFGKTIPVFSTLDSCIGLSTTACSALINHLNREKHSVSFYLEGVMPLDPDFMQSAAYQHYVYIWHKNHYDFATNGFWLRMNENGEEDEVRSEPTELIATDDDIAEWGEKTGLDQYQLTFVLYYNINRDGLSQPRGDKEKERTKQAELNCRRNELFLRYMAFQTNGNVYDYALGRRSVTGFFHRGKKMITKFSAALRLGTQPDLIQLSGYSLTMAEKFPTLASWNKSTEKGGIEADQTALHLNKDFKRDTDDAHKVTQNRIYTDNSGNAVDPTTALLGYRYGKDDIIPIDHQTKARLDIPTTKELTVLRAVQQSFLAPWFRCSGSDFIVGSKDSKSSQIVVSALAKCCKARQLVLLCRYVKRAGGTAEFGYLTPLFSARAQQAGFVYNRLPFKDDLRINSMKTIYVPLSDDDVQRYTAWRHYYDITYLATVKNTFVRQHNQNKYGNIDIKQELDSYLQELFDQQQAQGQSGDAAGQVEDETNQAAALSLPILSPQQLQEDDDNVMNKKRWAIKNRFPLAPTAHYLNALANNDGLAMIEPENHPFGYSATTLTDTQSLFKLYADSMLLKPDDFNPTEIHNPAYQRFFAAIRDRHLNERSDPASSLREVENILLTPHPARGFSYDEKQATEKQFLEHFQTLLERFRESRPVTIEQVVYDFKGRSQYKSKLQQDLLNQTTKAAAASGDAFLEAVRELKHAEKVKTEQFVKEETLNSDGFNKGKRVDQGLTLPSSDQVVLSESTPIADLHNYLNRGVGQHSPQDLHDLLTKFTTIILSLVYSATGHRETKYCLPLTTTHRNEPQYYWAMAYQAILELRSVCLQHDVPQFYNNFMQTFAASSRRLFSRQYILQTFQSIQQNPDLTFDPNELLTPLRQIVTDEPNHPDHPSIAQILTHTPLSPCEVSCEQFWVISLQTNAQNQNNCRLISHQEHTASPLDGGGEAWGDNSEDLTMKLFVPETDPIFEQFCTSINNKYKEIEEQKRIQQQLAEEEAQRVLRQQRQQQQQQPPQQQQQLPPQANHMNDNDQPQLQDPYNDQFDEFGDDFDF